MIARDAQPIAHHPPLKPIELRPVYPHAEQEPKSFWEMQYDESIRAERAARHERMWAAVVEFAQTRGGGPFPAIQSGADALNQSGASGAADEAKNEPAAKCAALEDDRNSTGLTAGDIAQQALERLGTDIFGPESYDAAIAELNRPQIWWMDGDGKMRVVPVENELGGVGE